MNSILTFALCGRPLHSIQFCLKSISFGFTVAFVTLVEF